MSAGRLGSGSSAGAAAVAVPVRESERMTRAPGPPRVAALGMAEEDVRGVAVGAAVRAGCCGRAGGVAVAAACRCSRAAVGVVADAAGADPEPDGGAEVGAVSAGCAGAGSGGPAADGVDHPAEDAARRWRRLGGGRVGEVLELALEVDLRRVDGPKRLGLGRRTGDAAQRGAGRLRCGLAGELDRHWGGRGGLGGRRGRARDAGG